jgi:hypothetical protein
MSWHQMLTELGPDPTVLSEALIAAERIIGKTGAIALVRDNPSAIAAGGPQANLGLVRRKVKMATER